MSIEDNKPRIVVKVGSAVLTEKNKIAKERMRNLVKFIAELSDLYNVVLVTSGAVAAGYSALKLDKRKQIGKKALAAAGQPILMTSYKRKFDVYKIDTAQILLTEDDFDSRKRTHYFQEIINAHLENDILPIVNENDITSTPDQVFGDNDQLSASVAISIGAKMLIILSDINGYYDSNPEKNKDAKLRKIVNELTVKELNDDSTANNEFATGGIVTKLMAAKIMMKKGREMLLCSGFDLTAASDYLINGNHTECTLFTSKVSDV